MYLCIFSQMANIYVPTLTQTLSIFDVISPPLFMYMYLCIFSQMVNIRSPTLTQTFSIFNLIPPLCIYICIYAYFH